MGDLNSHHKVIDLIISYDKVCIHLAKIKEISINFIFLKNYIKQVYDTEKYKAIVNINNKTNRYYKKGLPSKISGKNKKQFMLKCIL